MSDFRTRCLRFIERYAEANLLEAGGLAGPRLRHDALERLTRDAVHVDRTATLAVALLGDPQWTGQPHPAAAALCGLASQAADDWARYLIRRCRVGQMPPDFELIGFAQTVRQLQPHASAGRKRLWHKAAEAGARATVQFLLRKRAAWGKPGPYTGTGPNHLFLLGASLYRTGDLLARPEWTHLARRLMRRLGSLQAEEGYFPEDVGPAVRYHQVSLFGLCDYYAASGDESVRRSAERAVQFSLRAMYPDLSVIETFDQRNRSSTRPGQVGKELHPWSLAWGLTPAGLRLAETILGRMMEQPAEGRAALPRAGAAALALVQLAGRTLPRPAALPCERASYVDRFDGQAAIVRRDGWCVALSGYHCSNRPGNPFILDRTQAISVFQDRAGLVIGGGNDKRNLSSATFELVESGYVRYFPPIAGRAGATGHHGWVELDYGAATARLEAVVRSRRLVELTAGAVTNFGEQADRFNLQIPVGHGAKIVIDGRAIRLSKGAKGASCWPVKRWLELPGLARIELAGGRRAAAAPADEFCWPHLPHNSYNIPTHAGNIEAAVGFLRLGLSGDRLAERRVRIITA